MDFLRPWTGRRLHLALTVARCEFLMSYIPFSVAYFSFSDVTEKVLCQLCLSISLCCLILKKKIIIYNKNLFITYLIN